MGYDAKPIFFLEPSISTPQIKETMEKFMQIWFPLHSYHKDLHLYHYTSLDGLKGIIQSRSLWFTHTSTLNDPLELKYGNNLILEILSEKMRETDDTNIIILLQSLINEFNSFDIIKYQTYVACFCKSDNLLSQWRSYSAQGGGYNLGFWFNSNTNFYHDLNNGEKSHIILRKIIYDKNEQARLVSEYVSSIIDCSKKAQEWHHEVGNYEDAWPMMVSMEAVNILFDLMLSFKNPVFSEENEWRLIKSMQDTYKPELIKFRENNNHLIPYIETYIVDELEGKLKFPLDSIRFGPMLKGESTKSAIELFAKKESALDHKISIDTSKLKVIGAGYELR